MVAQTAQPQSGTRIYELLDPDGLEPRIMIRASTDRLTPAKKSPRHGWEFPYTSVGYGRRSGPPASFLLRTAVYSQRDPGQDMTSERAARMLMRLWNYNITRLNLDHAPAYNEGIVDVYLCEAGKAGGEQRFDVEDLPGGARRNVNTVYVYDLASFKDPLEMAREIAHEYGHATLPPVGTFTEPEAWANGELGERLFLSWLRDDMRAGRLSSLDAMGAGLAGLNSYYERSVRPLVVKGLTSGPAWDLLRTKGKAGMDAYLSLVMTTEALLPQKAFGRAMVLNSLATARGYADAAVAAAREVPTWTVRAAGLKGRSIWLPLGNGKLSGATLLSRRGGWANVRVQADEVVVKNPPIKD